jgi:hypothetical protein
MKRLLLLFVLLCPACHAPTTIVTPQGQRAYTADQVVVRINELQNAAIELNKNNGLNDVVTRRIVTFAVQADTVLKQAPAGWQIQVSALWNQVKADLPLQTNQAIIAAMNAVDVVLALGGN